MSNGQLGNGGQRRGYRKERRALEEGKDCGKAQSPNREKTECLGGG